VSLELNILAFPCSADPVRRDAYHIGLEQVLLYYGVSRVTSQSREWFDDPNTYLVIVENRDNGMLLGGARMQRASESLSLPMEKAIGFKDPRVYDIVKQYVPGGVAEFCGLWNSRRVAGMGLGSMFLGRACIAIAPAMGLKTVLGLCAPSTKENSFKIGFHVDLRLGKNGEFDYPKENLVATALMMEDPVNIPGASEEDRNRIFELRNNPNIISDEQTQRGEIRLHYSLI
jgi:hypothetical protein